MTRLSNLDTIAFRVPLLEVCGNSKLRIRAAWAKPAPRRLDARSMTRSPSRALRSIYNCGRAENGETTERLRRLAHSILRRCAPEEIVAENPLRVRRRRSGR
jgi:hypothetical protein